MPSFDPPACEGGRPVREEYLPISIPFIGQEEKDEVIRALESGWLSSGPRTKKFEEKLTEYVEARFGVAVSSCTAGLHLALLAAGVGPGDEVITSPLTFVSTANVILHTGATPVFADVRRDTYTVSVDEVRSRITPRTRAIIPVHYAGQVCDLDEIRELAQARNIAVIEDAAHAIGAEYRGKKVGSFEDTVAVFSFYATKNLTTGEGGFIATGNEMLAESMRALAAHGITRDAWKRYSEHGTWFYDVVAAGFKYNLTDMQAALGLCQLRRIEDFLERRGEIAARYDERLGRIPAVRVPYVEGEGRHARYMYPILIEVDQLTIDRGRFVEALRAENIGTSVHFIPVHLHTYYREKFGYKRGALPNAEFVYDREISLPLFPQMSDQDVDDVVAGVEKLVAHYRRKGS